MMTYVHRINLVFDGKQVIGMRSPEKLSVTFEPVTLKMSPLSRGPRNKYLRLHTLMSTCDNFH